MKILVLASCLLLSTGESTRGTRAASGTRMLSKWHARSHHLKLQIARNLPFSGNIFPHFSFLPYEKWSCDIVGDSGRYTYVKKNVFLMNLGKVSVVQYKLIIISKIWNILSLHVGQAMCEWNWDLCGLWTTVGSHL